MKRSICSGVGISCILIASVLTAQLACASPAKTSGADGKIYNLLLSADLRTAVQSNDVGRVHKLLSRGADPNTTTVDELAAPLVLWIIAADADDKLYGPKWQIVHELVEAGTNLEMTNSQGIRPLAFTASNGDVSILRYLVKAGANLEAKSPEGFTPLMVAASHGQSNAVQALIESGADVNARSKINGTALIAAAIYDPNTKNESYTEGFAKSLHLEAARYLVAAGADVNARTTDGEDAIAMADANGLPKLAEYLRGVKASPKNDAPTTPVQSTTDAASKEDALKKDATGSTTLMQLILVDEKPFDTTKAAAFVKAGVDVNAVNDMDQTALNFACVSGSSDAVRFLVKNGVKVNYADKTGVTSLMYATQIDDEASALDVIGQLIAAGADVNAKDHDRETVLVLARARNNQHIVDALVKAGAK